MAAANLHAGQWTPVRDLAGRSWEGAVAIEYPGPQNDLPFFGLLRVEPAEEDGEFEVFGTFMESDRVWASLFKGDELLLVDPQTPVPT